MIKRRFGIFIAVGGTTVMVDFLVYTTLISFGIIVGQSKGISFLCGSLYSYYANKHWTFGDIGSAPYSVVRFSLLYAATLTVNVSTNELAQWLWQGPSNVLLAFLTATCLSAALNFIGMRYFVFCRSPEDRI